MGFTLRDGVSFCLVGGTPLFLDRTRDRYFGLPQALEHRFLSLLAGEGGKGKPDLSVLVSRGLLVRTDGDEKPAACHPLPRPEATLLDGLSEPRTNQLLLAGACLLITKLSLATMPWSRTLDRLSRRVTRLEGRSAELDRIATVAIAFDRLGLWLSPLDQCVPRSLAVMKRCLAIGQGPSLVIGVKLDPFAAHCWVQAGKTLVNERIEKARAFTPIWVL